MCIDTYPIEGDFVVILDEIFIVDLNSILKIGVRFIR